MTNLYSEDFLIEDPALALLSQLAGKWLTVSMKPMAPGARLAAKRSNV